MLRRRWTRFCLLLWIAATATAPAAAADNPFLAAAARAPAVAASSYILMDAASGTVLAERDADTPLPPASLTKLMTTYLAFEALQNGVVALDTLVTISANAWAQNVVGSKMFLEVNTQVSVEDLLRGVIIQSGNDASIALAEYFGGTQSAFAEQMNAKAEQLGLTQSTFANATGLPAAGQVMSARDAAIVARRTILDFPQWYPMYAEQEWTYNGIRQENRNRLLWRFAGADGLKTGYTQAAGYSLVSSARRGERRLIAVVMKTESARARLNESEKLLTYGFNNFRHVQLFDADARWQLPIYKGVKDLVRVRIDGDGMRVVAKGTQVESQIFLQPVVEAPIPAGAAVGRFDAVIGGEVVQSFDIVTDEGVGEAGWFKWIEDAIKVKYLGHRSDGELLLE